MRWLGVLGIMTLVACSSSSNGGNCSSTGSLEISLADANSEEALCNATVTLTVADGGSPEPLMLEGTGSGCNYFIAVKPGQFTLTASLTGYQTLTQSLLVTPDGCGVESPTLALELLPSM